MYSPQVSAPRLNSLVVFETEPLQHISSCMAREEHISILVKLHAKEPIVSQVRRVAHTPTVAAIFTLPIFIVRHFLFKCGKCVNNNRDTIAK